MNIYSKLSKSDVSDLNAALPNNARYATFTDADRLAGVLGVSVRTARAWFEPVSDPRHRNIIDVRYRDRAFSDPGPLDRDRLLLAAALSGAGVSRPNVGDGSSRHTTIRDGNLADTFTQLRDAIFYGVNQDFLSMQWHNLVIRPIGVGKWEIIVTYSKPAGGGVDEKGRKKYGSPDPKDIIVGSDADFDAEPDESEREDSNFGEE